MSEPGVILVNPRSGNGTDVDGLRRAFDGHRVVECSPDTFDAAITSALEGSPSFVGMAGGDGSMRSVAAALVGTGVPMLTIPEGTRNHLARDLGIATVDDAVEAAGRGERITIDVGEVDGQVFVNTFSIGTYPAMVRDRTLRQRRWAKPVANLLAAVEQMRRGRRSTVAIDDRRQEVWSVFVGNGRYGTGLTDLTSREDLADGLLDVRIVKAGRLGRTRLVLAALTGRLERSPFLETERARSLVLDAPRTVLDVALDGEVVQLTTPLHVECRPGALVVLVPHRSAHATDPVP